MITQPIKGALSESEGEWQGKERESDVKIQYSKINKKLWVIPVLSIPCMLRGNSNGTNGSSLTSRG